MEEKTKHGFVMVCTVIIFLGAIAFSACISAEFKRTKVKDVKFDSKLCSLPGSHAFRLGITASICLLAIQIIGNSMVCRHFCSREKITYEDGKKQWIAATSLLVLSWFSFGIAIVLLATATSMNRKQSYGKGWLDEECYTVKDGVYTGSGALVLVTVASMMGSILTTRKGHRKKQVEEGRKMHAGER
ncbi:hypothetical protein GIB67_038412 [Kingdonia uniflora]|uniref:Uncharacterized protein n=1 Tax=Kingdonia uniflora TaxID=39325 RepID=A0A7J7NNZ9_9MAGN|nr:hypothetical protein GIB67_038412 [Kingdonia uniflora]